MTGMDAFKQALRLAINAPTNAQSERATALAEELAQLYSFDRDAVDTAKLDIEEEFAIAKAHN